MTFDDDETEAQGYCAECDERLDLEEHLDALMDGLPLLCGECKDIDVNDLEEIG